MLHAGIKVAQEMIDYDGRTFQACNSGADPTIATYRQHRDLLWGVFSGGHARRGSLTGLCAPDGTLRFAYTIVTHDDEVISGHCVSTPEVLDDGRIRLNERYVRYGLHQAQGHSTLEEIRA